ncbi:hypothetical protein PTD2_06959 [Pseudoalteromonas tunicata D2]|uniref:Uncharacterized protein n=1 Tax=Pseudoalteromonas tunicata D2 TaxID=87626 RepID=A4C847_9GAMM|nr:hypothetical protein PTD2_06959 [Pseudoalteromonas tunicata D2]
MTEASDQAVMFECFGIRVNINLSAQKRVIDQNW